MRKLLITLLAIGTLLMLLAVPSLAAPGGNGNGNGNGKQEPKLNISSVERVPAGVRVHFVLVHNAFTEAQLNASTLTFQYRVSGGVVQTGTATFDRITGGTAHFEATLPIAVTGTFSVTGGALAVAGRTIALHNTLTETLDCTPQPRTGTLKICKVLAPGTTVPAGTLFTFNGAGVGTVSIAPGTCSALLAVAPGSVQVTETGPAGFEVTAIRFLAGTGTIPTLPAPVPVTASATVVAGQTTEIEFTNRGPVVPP